MLHSCRVAASIQDKSGKTPLHVACWNGTSENIRLLLRANKDAASIPDNRGRTPLHHACYSVSLPCADTIRSLIEADPRVPVIPDHTGKTPLSLLCERHSSKLKAAVAGGGPDVFQTVLQPFWEQLRALLSIVADRRVVKGDGHLLHIVTSIPGCPQILFDLALKLHPEQVRQKVYGSLPLHYAAESPTSHQDIGHSNDYIVNSLLHIFPEASRVPDASGCLPLHLAIRSGKSFQSVVKGLFQSYPDAIRIRDGDHFLFPSLLAALPNLRHDDHHDKSRTHIENILELLRLDPSVVAQHVAQ